MNKRKLLLLLMLTPFIVFLAGVAGCIYHKPPFQGQILDRDTKQPIEGAVVVAVYEKTHHGFEPLTHSFHVREALTDKEGKFRIPSYTSLIMPIYTTEASVIFTIYKPGYASISDLNLEDHLSEKKTLEEEGKIVGGYNGMFGFQHKDQDMSYYVKAFPHGVIVLPKMMTGEERKDAWMNAKIGIHRTEAKASDLPVSFRMIEEESRNVPRSGYHVPPPPPKPAPVPGR